MKTLVATLAIAALLGVGACTDSSDEHPAPDEHPALATHELTPLAGLYAVDDTPLTTTVPMTPVIALTDRDYGANAGIALGPDGVSYQNVGLDLGRSVAVDELQIFIRTAAGNLVASGAPVTWTVYTSADGLAWTAAAPGNLDFDPSASRYALAFPSTTARFFKAVNLGTLASPAYITELCALAHF